MTARRATVTPLRRGIDGCRRGPVSAALLALLAAGELLSCGRPDAYLRFKLEIDR